MNASERAHALAGTPELVEEWANCVGVTSKGPMQLRGNGCLVIGDRRLVFAYLVIGRTIAIERGAIRRIETVRSHLGKATATKMLKVYFVDDAHLYDSVAFIVRDLDAWTGALERVIEENAARAGRPATEASPLARTVTVRAALVPPWATASAGTVGAGFVLGGAALAVATAIASPVAVAIAGAALLAGGAGAIAQLLARRRHRARMRELAVDCEAGPEGLRVKGELVAETWSLRSGVVVPHAAGATVVLGRGALRPELRLEVASVEDGRAIVDALGLGAGTRALTRKVASWMFTRAGYAVALTPLLLSTVSAIGLGVAGLGEAAAAAFVGGVLWVLLSFYTAGLVKTRVTIGADGVRVAWLGRERVIPLAEIARVEAATGLLGARTVALHLRSGDRVDITVAVRGSNLFEPFDAQTEQALIVERIEAARRLGANLETASLDAWMEARGDLPITAWVRELRLHVRAAMREGRDEVVSALLHLAERATAAPALRAAAAVALGPALDPTARERLRAAAEASAVPKVRVALEAAAADHDADLVEVFAELSDAHRAQVRVELDEELMAEAEHEVEALLAEEGSVYRGRAP